MCTGNFVDAFGVILWRHLANMFKASVNIHRDFIDRRYCSTEA